MNFRSCDFIVFSLQPWDGAIGSNCVNIAHELSKHTRVLYVNYPLDVKTFLTGKSVSVKNRKAVFFGRSPELNKVASNVWVLNPRTLLLSINSLPKGYIFNSLHWLNNWFFAQRVRKTIKRLSFQHIGVFNDSDMFRAFYMKELLQPEFYLYYSRDNLMSVPYWKKHGQYIEPELVAKSTACFANSVFLQKKLEEHNKHSFFVGQGCDLTLWSAEAIKKIPEDLSLDKPVIGYVGALVSLRLDVDLLLHLAEKFPQCRIVLLGPCDEVFQRSELNDWENVIFLGNKKPEELANYVAYFNVCINPQLVNEATIGNYPRKIDEYLAMGKPVVATKTEGMSMFEEYVYLAEGKNQFAEMVGLALAENSSLKASERIAFAHTHTWGNSVNLMMQGLNTVLNAQ